MVHNIGNNNMGGYPPIPQVEAAVPAEPTGRFAHMLHPSDAPVDAKGMLDLTGLSTDAARVPGPEDKQRAQVGTWLGERNLAFFTQGLDERNAKSKAGAGGRLTDEHREMNLDLARRHADEVAPRPDR